MRKIIKDQNRSIELVFAQYGNLVTAIQGVDAETKEPWNTYTTNIPDACLPPNCTILDTNNSPKILQILVDAGIVEDSGYKVKSGFCTYPVVEVLK